MIEIICWWQLCLNVAGNGMACEVGHKGNLKDLTDFIGKNTGTAKIILSECPKPGSEPSLTFQLPPGLRAREMKE